MGLVLLGDKTPEGKAWVSEGCLMTLVFHRAAEMLFCLPNTCFPPPGPRIRAAALSAACTGGLNFPCVKLAVRVMAEVF